MQGGDLLKGFFSAYHTAEKKAIGTVTPGGNMVSWGKDMLQGEAAMLKILIGRAKSGKSDTVLRRIAELGDSSRQILLVPEHASHLAEVDLCRACGPTASRHAEVLSFRRLADRVLSLTGGAADVTWTPAGSC